MSGGHSVAYSVTERARAPVGFRCAGLSENTIPKATPSTGPRLSLAGGSVDNGAAGCTQAVDTDTIKNINIDFASILHLLTALTYRQNAPGAPAVQATGRGGFGLQCCVIQPFMHVAEYGPAKRLGR